MAARLTLMSGAAALNSTSNKTKNCKFTDGRRQLVRSVVTSRITVPLVTERSSKRSVIVAGLNNSGCT